MIPSAIDALLIETLEDARLSRKERHALNTVCESITRDVDRAAIRQRCFELARAASTPDELQGALNWLEGVVKALDPKPENNEGAAPSEAYFSPGEQAPRRIVQLLNKAARSVDVCVFTITDNRLSDAILETQRRGVAVRIITDNDKALDEGSDVERFRAAAIPIVVDRTEYHMHHKFAIFDGAALLTGSYNWTRGASAYNQDNFIVTHDPRLVSVFQDTFDRLWHRLQST
jgi:phosphatidylserine/phosphatidylglycerophosphate/cardiolipin synthase-like enzyme